MFLVSMFNICFCKLDYIGLVVISSGLGVVFVCWFVIGLFGIIMMDFVVIWYNIEVVMVEMMS